MKPSVSQEELKNNLMKHNQNELLKQIEEKRNREQAERNRQKMEDYMLENKVKEDLKRMNQNFIKELTKEGGKKGNYNVNSSLDLSQGDRRERKDTINAKQQKGQYSYRGKSAIASPTPNQQQQI